VIREGALLAQERAGVKNPSTPGVAGLSPDSGRISEVVKQMWGDEAILNQELGLGLDNAPVPARSAITERVSREGLPATDAGNEEESGSPGSVAKKGAKYVLFLACGLLAAALAAVGWRRLKT
jgi:hypothetical protein